MRSAARRWTLATSAIAIGATMAVGGLAASSAIPAAVSAAVSAPGSDPTITIRVGGVRTAENGPPGPPSASGLAGVTFRVTPSSAGQSDVCVSTAAGLCPLNVTANRTYTITQAVTPTGWFDSQSLAAGSPGSVTPYAYSTLSVAVGNSNVTVPIAAPNTDRSPTARSGMWALSRDDPALPDGCGLRIALLIDLSSSITSTVLPTYKAAATAFVQALAGTPSTIAIYTFGTNAPASGANNANLPPVSVATQAGVTTLINKINGLTVPSGSATNWDAGLWQIVRDNPVYHYQSTIILTDGDPTQYGPPGNLGGTGNLTRFAETENGVFSANALKDDGTSVISVGIGTSSQGLRYTNNIRAISGPVEGTDYFNTDFARLSAVLAELALRNCAGADIAKSASPATYARPGETIDYSYTVTNPKFFTLHDVHVTDDRIAGPIACTPSTLTTGQSASCHASYTITQADVDAGHLTNIARAIGTTPNGDNVTSGPADQTVAAVQAPRITLAKAAFPDSYAAAGEEITYSYPVTNTGNVTLHDVAVSDDRIGAIACPLDTLAPGESTTCEAVHVTTEEDVAAGQIANTATVTGDPRTGSPVHDSAEAIVHAIHDPAIQIEKTAFPDTYALPGDQIRYTYTVVNAGNAALHGIDITDTNLGAIDCPATALAPAESMTCHATHIVTVADLDAGSIVNTATATGYPPSGPAVRDSADAVARAFPDPAIQIEKTAFPDTYAHAGETISYAYTVVNAGVVTLHDVTVTDDRLRAVDCPATALAPAESMTCHATHIVTMADLDAGSIVNTATATGYPPSGPAVRDGTVAIIEAARAPRVALVKSAFPDTYGAAGESISYTYTVTNTGNADLRDVTVTDDRLSRPLDCLKTTLLPGESTTCQATHITTSADVVAGHITNTAVVTAQPPTGPAVRDSATTTVRAIHAPGIQIEKAAFPDRYSVPGERITYDYTVVNTGNATLHAIRVTDDRLGAIGCPATVLAPGESMTCHATYTVSKANVTGGRIIDTGTVTGMPPTGPAVHDSATKTVEVMHAPGIQLNKSARPASYWRKGAKIIFTYTVANTGNVPLRDITVTDKKIRGAINCRARTLAPGASTTCRAAYVITWADVKVGYVTNIATVTGRTPAGLPVSDRAEDTVMVSGRPCLSHPAGPYHCR